MGLINFTFGTKKTADQFKLGRGSNLIGSYDRMGLGFAVDEFNLFSQIKDYRTDLLNGTNWRPVDPINDTNFQYIQFIKLLDKYSTAIFNDFITIGYAIFAKIDGNVFYISPKNYTINTDKVTIHGYPNAEVFEFNDPNVFCGEVSIFNKCKPYQRLYNISFSCQKNGMSKSGFVNVVSPKSSTGLPTAAKLTDIEKLNLEKEISEKHGVATDEQTNFLIFQQEIDIKTILFDFAKLGIFETKKACEEYVCSKLGVPYVLLPSGGQTFANYEEANKILYENHSKYCEYFCNFAKNELKFNIDYKTIAEDTKGIDQAAINPLNGAQISSLLEILASVSGLLITKDAAISIITSSFPQVTVEQATKILKGVNIGVSEAVNAPDEPNPTTNKLRLK